MKINRNIMDDAVSTKRARTEELDTPLERIRGTRIVAELTEEEAKTAICTHSGTFHADEALACAMLKCLPQYRDSVIVRTRSPDIISKCKGVVVDVGGKYDPSDRRLDHHQRSFGEEHVYPGFNMKLSSAGLVYKHFGAEIIRSAFGPFEKDGVCAELTKKVYEKFIKEIDAIDNGVSVAEDLRYRINTNLSARVSRLNPRWNAKVEETSDAARNARFKKAMEIAFDEFSIIARDLRDSWLPARAIVRRALQSPVEVGIVKLERYCPWSGHLFDVERELGAVGKTLYVLYQDTAGKWRVQAVPVSEGSFQSRKKLPEPWRGVRGKELDDATGLNGCIFVHAAGFIGGAETYDVALALARKALL